jgi:hypothetical protein
MKPINAIVGVCVGIAIVSYVKTHDLSSAIAGVTPPASAQAVQAAAPAPPAVQAAAPTAPPTTHLPAVIPKPGLVIRGVKMPTDCQDPAKTGTQNLVTYVEQHNDPNAAGYVPDADVDDYVCGWN